VLGWRHRQDPDRRRRADLDRINQTSVFFAQGDDDQTLREITPK
jgi:hypothetical protein